MAGYNDIDSDEEEMPPFVAPTLRNKKTTAHLGVGVLANRLCILILLFCLVGVSIYFQSELTELDSQLQSDESKISTLETIIQEHEVVIERFNNSVTNSDVVKQLNQLRSDLQSNEKEIRSELTSVRAEISDQLQTVLNELAQKVTEAEDAINGEVDRVEKNFEQYKRTTQDQFSMENSFMIYQLAGTFTILSCLISMWHMTAHLRKFNEPIVQRKILAILWMSPVYAITSWFSLVFHSAEEYLAIIKDFYEAYVIYQFLSFCIAVLGRGDRNAVVERLAHHADHLSPPFRFDAFCNKKPYDSDRALAEAVLLQCQAFAMQFVFLRPLTTLVMFVLDKLQYYGPNNNQWDYLAPQVYIVGLQNLSVFIAFTGLLKFYHAVDKDLAWCRPFAKFLCIKGVVFMTFWQGLAIAILASTTDVGGTDTEEWARSAQNFLICLEMLLFSIAHFYTFPTEEWVEGYRASHEGKTRFGDSIALGDFFQDLKLILKSQKKKKLKQPDSDITTITEHESECHENDDESRVSISTISKTGDSDVEDIEKAVEEAIAGVADIGAVERLENLADRILENSSWEAADSPYDYGNNGDYGINVDGGDYGNNVGDYGEADLHSMGMYSGGIPEETESSNDIPTETTGLLGRDKSPEPNRSSSDEILRPSIFTTIADVARVNSQNSSSSH